MGGCLFVVDHSPKKQIYGCVPFGVPLKPQTNGSHTKSDTLIHGPLFLDEPPVVPKAQYDWVQFWGRFDNLFCRGPAKQRSIQSPQDQFGWQPLAYNSLPEILHFSHIVGLDHFAGKQHVKTLLANPLRKIPSLHLGGG